MKDEKQQLARDLFIHAGKTQTEIADMLDVNRKTVYLWMKKGKWEEIMHAASQAPGIIVSDVYDHIAAVNRKIRTHDDGCPTPVEVDMLRKLVKITKDIPRTYTGAYIQAYEEVSSFMLHKDIGHAKKFVEYADEYIRGKFGDGTEQFKATDRARKNVAEVERNLKLQEEQEFDYPCEEKSTEFSENEAPVNPKLRTTHLGKNGAFSEDPENTIPINTGNAFSEKNTGTKCPISAIKKYIESGAFHYSANPRPPLVAADMYTSGSSLGKKETWRFMPVDHNGIPVLNAAYYATLLPAHRPSPYRQGTTIWINHPDDLENYQQYIKMSDTIRRYDELIK